MAITILPRDYNPWVQALPTFIQNMALQKMSQKFKGEQLEEQRDIRVGEREIDRKQQLSDIDAARKFSTSERVAGETHALNKDPLVQQIGGSIGVPKDSIKIFQHGGKVYAKRAKRESSGPIKGENFYWVERNGQFVKTKVPVPQENVKEAPQERRKAQQAVNIETKKIMHKWRGRNPNALTEDERRVRDKDVTRMAMAIEDNPQGPGVKQQVRFFNDHAIGTSVYLFKTKKARYYGKDTQEAVRVDLPVRDGRQLTAVDVRATLAKNKDKTLEDFLRAIKAIE